MKKGWPTKTLGEVCQFRGGGTPSKAVERYWLGNIPWVSPKDMKFDVVSDSIDHISQEAIDGSATSLIPKDSVLMVVRSGILARIVPIAITGRALTINQDLKALCPNGTVDARFLYHLLDSRMELLLSMVSRGATVHRLMTDQIRDIDFVLPPLAEQQRIVGLLDEAFEGLATAKANAETNLQNARALFESHLQSVFTARGPGWVEKPLGEALFKTETTDPTRSPQSEFDYIDVSSVSKETLTIEETQRLQGKDAPSRARKLVRTNDVLFATIRPTLRRIAIVPEELDSQVCSTGYFVLRAKPDVDHRLVFYFLQTEIFMTAMETLQKGASYPAVTDGEVRSQTIPIPPLKEQKKIASKLESLREETQRLARLYEQKHAALEALKKSLLHQAFTGEL